MEGAPAGTMAEQGITPAELRLAARNHALPLEALREDITPAGLHYLLIHYDIPAVDAERFRLEVGGAVERSRTLSLGELRERERVAEPITFECAGNGRALLEPRPLSQPWLTEAVGTAEWGGTPLAPLLEEAGMGKGAVDVLFSALDSGIEGGVAQTYERALPVEAVEHALLAYDMNGAPLPPQHGFPLRLVVPGWYGMQNVKWLTRITVLEEPYTGFQNAVAYRMYGVDGEPGEPVTRMLPRSLTVPPGVPDFMTRTRHLTPGRTTLTGKAWSGHGPIASVQVSTDNGETWADAELRQPVGDHAWRGWTHDWDAAEGEHVVSSRATDAAGNAQPLEPPWNLKGYANNAVERIPVTVRPPA
jgi:DMSO/TMAO reductase YedYZ molybdopterin-dependent catalytic subunit